MPKAKRTTKKKPFWERGYLGHGYWLGGKRLGSVKLGAKGEGVYLWQAGTHAGETQSLKEAKRAVEQAVLVGASQLPLF